MDNLTNKNDLQNKQFSKINNFNINSQEGLSKNVSVPNMLTNSSLNVKENVKESAVCNRSAQKDQFNNKVNFVIPSFNTIRDQSNNKTNFVIPNLSNVQENQTNYKNNFVIPNLIDVQGDHSNSKNSFVIPNLSNIQRDHSNIKNTFVIPNLNNAVELNKPEASTEFNSLSEIVTNHLQLHINSFLKDKVNAMNIDEQFDDSLTNLKDLKITDVDNNLDIHNNIQEQKNNLQTTFDVSYFLKMKVGHQKSVTNFGKVICRKYRRHNPIVNRTYDAYLRNINVFTFNTESPDDLIKIHLHRLN